MNQLKNNNLDYQAAPGESGVSYTDGKLRALRLPSLKGKRFLDLGCNAGFYCGVALEQGASRVVGVDMDPQVIVKARGQYPGAEFSAGGWDDFPGGEFDVIICLSAIHYAADPVRLVDQVHAHLAPGGLFVLEGGFFDDGGAWHHDILVPTWRQVGDRCRHLSRGYVANHLLRSFEWRVVGASEMRGGDPVPRVVIHANAGMMKPAINRHFVDLVAFARQLAVSAPTIVPAMPSYRYVRELGAMPEITAAGLETALSVAGSRQAFHDDLIHALGSRRPLHVDLALTVGPEMAERVCGLLKSAGITSRVTPAAAGATGNTVAPKAGAGAAASTAPAATPAFGCRSMGAYIPVLAELPNNLEMGALKGKVVADLGTRDPALPAAALAAGAAHCYVLDAAKAGATAGDSRVQYVAENVWNTTISGVDVAFFDARSLTGFNSVHDVKRLLAQCRRLLKPDGVLFAVLLSSYITTDIDVVNSIVITPAGPLPSSPYLYEVLLSDYSVRMLDRPAAQSPMVVSRLFRIMPKRPTLLLIFGQSQAGKTSLAREFKALDSHAHVSNDYVFFEIAKLKEAGKARLIDPEILAQIGDSSGVSCGRFNRALDADAALLKKYLAIVEAVIPVGKSLLTMEFDLRQPRQYEVVKAYFSNRGYSVWTVTR